MHYCRAAGQALTKHFYSAPVQSFINSKTVKALDPDKAIYQSGTQRKVIELFTKYYFTYS